MTLVSKLKICPRPFRILQGVDGGAGLSEWRNIESVRANNNKKRQGKMKKKKKADTQMARHSQALGAVPWEKSPQQRARWLEDLELWAGRQSLAVWFFWCWRKQDIAHSSAVSGLHQRHLTPTHASSFWRGTFQTLGFVLSGLRDAYIWRTNVFSHILTDLRCAQRILNTPPNWILMASTSIQNSYWM